MRARKRAILQAIVSGKHASSIGIYTYLGPGTVLRKEQASNLYKELEEVAPALRLGINVFLEGPSPSLTQVEAGWKVLVDDEVVNLENLSEIEEVAASFWLKIRWVHRNLRHLLMIYTPET